MRKYIALLILITLSTASFAGILPGGIRSSIEIKYEDDQQDADQSVAKTKLTFKKDVQLGGVELIPYVYFEDESYDGILSAASRKETESALGLDFLAFQNDQIKLTLGAIYEYEDNAAGDDDAQLIYKFKVDF